MSKSTKIMEGNLDRELQLQQLYKLLCSALQLVIMIGLVVFYCACAWIIALIITNWP